MYCWYFVVFVGLYVLCSLVFMVSGLVWMLICELFVWKLWYSGLMGSRLI